MSTPHRRSSRLRTPGKSINRASHQLSSLAERDETPTRGAQFDLNYILSSPMAPQTPATAPPKPSTQDMHPSRTHQSTTKEPDSGLRLGFMDIEKKGNDMPSGVGQQTPSKLGTSSSFDFKFARPGPELSTDAQRMMDNLREHALQIKAKLAAEREEQRNTDQVAGVGERKIAQPKGKAGRYSDVHMAEFKKMDSIEGHPSAFRAQPGRSTPAKPNLKRSQSKANLDDREAIEAAPKTLAKSILKRTQSKANLGDREEVHASQKNAMATSERLENTAPAKRARQNMADDISAARPVSRGDQTPKTMPSTPPLARSQSTLFTSITTPTKASLARAATAKQPPTQIPVVSKSPSKPTLTSTPGGLTKLATMGNISSVTQSQPKSILRSPGKFDRVKSSLGYPSSSKKHPNAASAPASSIPSLVRSPSKPNLHKDLPTLPLTPTQRSATSKHVNFTPDAVNKNAATFPNSPSPFKSAIPQSASRVNLVAKDLTATVAGTAGPKSSEVHYPSITYLPTLSSQPRAVEYPSLVGVRPLPEPRRQKVEPRPAPSVPGTFSFRSDHTIEFGASPKGFGFSPGQSSVRQVRPSIFPGTMPGAFPESTSTNKENKRPLPSIPHGMSNKKRRRADSEEGDERQVERSPKKQKPNVPEGDMLMAPRIMAEKLATASKFPSPAKKKNVLSLSRLNMLSRPKNRK